MPFYIYVDFEENTCFDSSSKKSINFSKVMDNTSNVAYSSVALAKAGFQTASQSKIPSMLRYITPRGQTAFRDSIMVASKIILDIAKVL